MGLEMQNKERGKLKLFLGAGPGVGKTYAMLSEALEKRKRGVDIVIGWVECRGHKDCRLLIEQLELIPRLKFPSYGFTYERLDVEAIIKRHPETVVIDDLQDRNPPNCPRKKRWQDVEAILDAGINVFTALNIQNLESLNDVVEKALGYHVKETVPDSLFDHADEVRFVDLPPDDLLMRLQTGKVVIPKDLEDAASIYFKKSNLIALRELALRYMTNRVDGEVKLNRSIENYTQADETRFGMLLVLEYITDLDAIRHAARIARPFAGGWHCVWLKTRELNKEEREKVSEMLQLAQSLGATTDVIIGTFSKAVANYAHDHNLAIVSLVPASSYHFKKQRRKLRETAPDLSILSLPYPVNYPNPFRRFGQIFNDKLGGYGNIFRVILGNLILSGVFYPLYDYFKTTSFAMGYLLLTLIFSMRYGTVAASVSAVASVFCFDLWMVVPRGSFAVRDVEQLWTFLVMLTVGLVSARLVAHRKELSDEASLRERQTRMLYEVARALSPAIDEVSVYSTVTRIFKADLKIDCEFWCYYSKDNNLVRQQNKLSDVDIDIVHWCIEHRHVAGITTRNFADNPYLYIPMKTRSASFGVAVLKLRDDQQWVEPSNHRLISALMYLTTQTIDRLLSVEEARKTIVNMEATKLRNSILQSLSHDLRTPLTSIMNSAEALLSHIKRRDAVSAEQNAADLVDSTKRMVRLMSNLMEMARLQNDEVTLNNTWIPPEELIGMSKATLRERLSKFEVRTNIADDCPMFYGDPVLLDRVLANLLDNATKYCPEGSIIQISAYQEEQSLILSVEDNGPGLPKTEAAERIFEAFKRGQKESKVTGVGLGLAIAMTIARVHNAKLEAGVSESLGGACFKMTLPIVEMPELEDEEAMLEKITASLGEDDLSLEPVIIDTPQDQDEEQDKAQADQAYKAIEKDEESKEGAALKAEESSEQVDDLQCDDEDALLMANADYMDNYVDAQILTSPVEKNVERPLPSHEDCVPKNPAYANLIIGGEEDVSTKDKGAV